jgi:hypothetical protein
MLTTSTHQRPAGWGARCPTTSSRAALTGLRLPFRLRQPISANYRRDVQAHAEAMQTAWRWYRITAQELSHLGRREFLWLLRGLSPNSVWRHVIANEPVELRDEAIDAALDAL